MSNGEHNSANIKRALEEACAWQLRVSADPSLEVSEEFQYWLCDPANSRAFKGVNAAWIAADEFSVEPQLLYMRQAALWRARVATARRWQPQTAIRRAAAVIVVIGALGAGVASYLYNAPDVYMTGIGERRTVALSDGSNIALDSDTEVEVRYLKNARELTLDRGRARFDVAHDIARPFSVTAGNETVVAVGTSFDVEKIGSKVLVTLIHGRIVVKIGQATTLPARGIQRPAVSLMAGQELVATADIRPSVKPADLEVAKAWEGGRLVFNGDTLGEAVARVNRYTHQPIEVDASIASIRIIGAFNAGDVSSFVNAVTSYFPVQATTTADNVILLQPRS
jgi:transmembrane sensor